MYSFFSSIDSLASSLGLLRESAKTKKGHSPWNQSPKSKSPKGKEVREFEMFETPSYSRASSMESVGSGITLGRGF
jgi:hypothetical protein